MASFVRLVVCGGAASAVAFGVLAACESDERITYPAETDATPDVVARLPDAGPPSDANGDAVVVPKVDVDASDEPVVCTTQPCAVQLAAGDGHFCARMKDGTVRCWGDDTAGALGRGEPSDAGDAGEAGAPADPGSPRPVAALTGVVQISASLRTTCAVDEAGVVRCWGSNANGQLGLSASAGVVDGARHATPAAVAATGVFARVDVGAHTACAILVSGGTVCWGTNYQQQLARPDAGPAYGAPGPADLPPGAITRTGATPYTSFGLTRDGGLLTWGLVSGLNAASGRETTISPDPVPELVPTLHGVTGFAAGDTHACAVEDGAVMCWGQSGYAALCTGLGSSEVVPAPASMAGPAYPQQLAVARNNTCARLSDGTIRCCGDDRKGQLGTGKVGTTTPSFTPASAFKGHAVQVAVSDGATCALLRGGSVECWGSNDRGQLGRGGGDAGPHPAPAPVTF